MYASTFKLVFATSLIMGVLASTIAYVYVRDASQNVNSLKPRLQRDRQQLYSVTSSMKTGKPLMEPSTKP